MEQAGAGENGLHSQLSVAMRDSILLVLDVSCIQRINVREDSRPDKADSLAQHPKRQSGWEQGRCDLVNIKGVSAGCQMVSHGSRDHGKAKWDSVLRVPEDTQCKPGGAPGELRARCIQNGAAGPGAHASIRAHGGVLLGFPG